MTGLRLAARRWHTSIRKNLLRERRTRCTAKWACHSLVESNDPVGNLTRPLLLVSNAPFNFYAFHRSLLIKTPAFAIVSSNLSFTREKGKIPSFSSQISYRLKIFRTIRKGIELVTGELRRRVKRIELRIIQAFFSFTAPRSTIFRRWLLRKSKHTRWWYTSFRTRSIWDPHWRGITPFVPSIAPLK